MGWVLSSERELDRLEVLVQVDDIQLTIDNAANIRDLSPSGFAAVAPFGDTPALRNQ